MAIAFAVGDVLVPQRELADKAVLGQLEELLSGTASVTFRAGEVTPESAAASLEAGKFSPIGVGKPLLVEMVTIYTGDEKKERPYQLRSQLRNCCNDRTILPEGRCNR